METKTATTKMIPVKRMQVTLWIKSDENRKRRIEIFCMQHETGETEENHKTGRGMQNGIFEFDRVIEDMKKDRSDKYHQTITYLCFWMDWNKMVKMVLVRNSVV